jgi:hypothetical protein
MSKMVRLNDDVYLALKALASCEGKTLSGAVYALMHTSDAHGATEKRLEALESRIAELKALLLENENQKASQSPLFRQSTLKTDGLEAIRTPDLRRVKAMS